MNYKDIVLKLSGAYTDAIQKKYLDYGSGCSISDCISAVEETNLELLADAKPITYQDELVELHLQIGRLKVEVAHWKSNHANVVEKAAFLSQRPDLPVDRIPAYQALVKARDSLDNLKSIINSMHED